MSKDDLQRFLYNHSPFLEKDEFLESGTENILRLIRHTKVFPLHAIFHEICVIAEKLSLVQVHEYLWIKEKFNCNIDDLDWFFLGYTMPATIIVSACLMETQTGLSVLKNLNLYTNDKRLVELNLYKSDMQSGVFSLTFAHPKTKPQSIIDPVYEYINATPYNLKTFFQLGIESSRITANALAKNVESKLMPSN